MIKPLQVYLKTASSNQKTAWEDAGGGVGRERKRKEKEKANERDAISLVVI